MSATGPIVVLGAAGYLGVNTVDVLLRHGIVPRCGRRRSTSVLALRRVHARHDKIPEYVRADLGDREALVDALTGADVVLHVAGHYPRHSLDLEGSVATATTQMRNVLDAAACAGVRRLVYVSSTATVAPRGDGAPATENDTYAADPKLGTYHTVKWLTERMALAEDRFEVVVACPGACIGPWDFRVGTTAVLVGAALGALPPMPAGVVNPIATQDVGLALLRLATHERPPRRVLLSSDNLDLHELLGALAERFGSPPIGPPIPAADARSFADAEERRVLGTSERPRMAREIVDLVVHATPLDTSLAESVCSMRWTPVPEAVDRWVDWATRFRILPLPGAPIPTSPARA